MLYTICHRLIRLFSRCLFPVTVLGFEHVPKEGRFIIASNHLSNLDPILIGIAIDRPLNYVAKESLFKPALLGAFLRRVGAFPIRRGASDTRSIKEALKRLSQEKGLLIFPEGTRIAQGNGQKVLPGIGFIAARSAAPVVPAYITGSQQVLPPGARWPKRGRITVTFGPPVRYQQQDYAAFALQVRDRIYRLK